MKGFFRVSVEIVGVAAVISIYFNDVLIVREVLRQ